MHIYEPVKHKSPVLWFSIANLMHLELIKDLHQSLPFMDQVIQQAGWHMHETWPNSCIMCYLTHPPESNISHANTCLAGTHSGAGSREACTCLLLLIIESKIGYST